MTSATDRLHEALERAAVPVMRTSLTDADDLRAGWADAVEQMDDTHHWLHVGDQRPDCGDWCLVQQSIASFIRAMLGGDDEQA